MQPDDHLHAVLMVHYREGVEMKGGGRARWAGLSLLIAALAGVCLGQIAPSDSAIYTARVVSQSGQVSILKDSQPWALSAGDAVHVKDLIMTGVDGHALLEVSDGSTFEVFPN